MIDVQEETQQHKSSERLIDYALEYAARGWQVFPLHNPIFKEASKFDSRTVVCTCGNRECQKPGKHPRTKNGLKDASLDVSTIRQWWKRWPDANIGIRTGFESGIAVLDVDPEKGGDEALVDLISKYGELPPTPKVRTGGGGIHFYFKHPGGKVKSINGFLPGLDSKADGGYVCAPPSLHMSGRRYEWI